MGLADDIQFLVDDMKRWGWGHQSSWDYEADCRFAEYIGDTEATNALRRILSSHAPYPIIIAVHNGQCGHIQRRRLRALREMVKRGLAKAYWSGFYLEGPVRTRTYYLPGTWIDDVAE